MNDEPQAAKTLTDGTQIWTDDGRRFHLRARDLKSVHRDRPTVEQVRLEIARGRFVEGIHFVRTEDGRAQFTDMATKVGVGPRPWLRPRR